MTSKLDKLRVVDATRGWAILLVIATHASLLVPELPYPVRRLTNTGWYGVQLFFVASAFTLLLSWNRDAVAFAPRLRAFFLRRFLRIAPMYYTGALLYLLIRPPGDSFEWAQLAASVCFVNAWSPDWITTVPGRWQVVPGGWSISVEFTFYALFPLLASVVTTLRRAGAFLVLSIVLMWVSHPLGQAIFEKQYGIEPTDQYLFFWLPNQLVVFAIGFLLYFVYVSTSPRLRKVCTKLGQQQAYVLGGTLLAVVFLSLFGHAKHFVGQAPWLPSHFLLSCLFAVALLATLFAPRPSPLVVNSFMCRLGEVSFSAYVLHWAVLSAYHELGKYFSVFDVSGVTAIVCYVCASAILLFVTFAVSGLTYRLVELPAIDASRRWSRRTLFTGLPNVPSMR